MKCPKCGFVSFPGHEECKKCGHHFTQVNGLVEGIPPLFHHPASEQKTPASPEAGNLLDQVKLGKQDTREPGETTQPWKCPECNFINVAGVEQCKFCGHLLTHANGHAGETRASFDPTLSEDQSPAAPEPGSALDQTSLSEQEAGDMDMALEPQEPPPNPIPPKREKSVPKPSLPSGISPWQAELAERVQEYRQRRARLRKDEESSAKPLNLTFGTSAPQPEEPHANVIEFPSAEEPSSRSKSKTEVRSAPPSFGMGSFESAFREEKNERSIPPAPPPPVAEEESRAETGPLEIELGSSGDSPGGNAENDHSTVAIAQMSMRFFAGLIDSAILLAGAGIYALIFWQVGGRLTLGPLEIVVAGAIGAFFIILYFAGCTAVASATPGLMWARLEVITFEGYAPTLSHCLWRGIGYLVSITALMLGFIWAVVDAEGLTWHDRMSRTFIVPAEYQ